MDCFYAAIEIRDNPSLSGLPVAVGGNPNQRGVLCTCNYEARKYGIRSAMPSGYALRLCPNLVILPVNIPKYQAVSAAIQEIFTEFTDIIEPLSLDEAYLDVTNVAHHRGSATLIAEEIRRLIYNKQHLTASAGIAPNKFLAKVASDWHKPNGQFVIAPAQVEEFVKQLPINKIFGVGKVTAQKLLQMGIQTCADLRQQPLSELVRHFGKFGHSLFQLSRGIDERAVNPHQKRKSLSAERTFVLDLTTLQDCQRELVSLFSEVISRLEKTEGNEYKQIKTIFVKLKFADFTMTTVQKTAKNLCLDEFNSLLHIGFSRRAIPVRLLGLGVRFTDGTLQKSSCRQMDLIFRGKQ